MYPHVQYLIYNKLFYYAQRLGIIMTEYTFLNVFQCLGWLVTYTGRELSAFLGAEAEGQNVIDVFRNKIQVPRSEVGKLNAWQRNGFNVTVYS